MVLLLPAAGRTPRLLAMALQVDPLFQHAARHRLHLRQPAQTGNPLQDAHAGTAEPVVRTARHRLYVRLCAAWSVRRHGGLPALLQKDGTLRRGDGHLRQPGLCGTGLHDLRHAFRGAVGQGGMGALLVVGPEGDMGRHHLVRLPGVHPLPSLAQQSAKGGPYPAHRQLPPPANVLVGHQLPAQRTRRLRPHLQQLTDSPDSSDYSDYSDYSDTPPEKSY